MQQILAPKSIFRPGNLADLKEKKGTECHRELDREPASERQEASDPENRDDHGHRQITVRGAVLFPREDQQQDESERNK